MTILVTGGAGYIGSHTVLDLVEAGERVVVLDDLSTGFRTAVAPEAELVVGDAGDEDLVGGLIMSRGIDAIVHFAGSVVVPDSVTDPLGYYRNNTVGSRSLIAAAVKGGVRRFVFSSTAAVYGATGATPVVEGAATAPISPYGRSKLMTEMMLADTAAAHGLRFVALRYFNVAGSDPKGRAGGSPPAAPPTSSRSPPKPPLANVRASKCSAPTIRPPTEPASATTSTSRTLPAPTARRSAILRPAAPASSPIAAMATAPRCARSSAPCAASRGGALTFGSDRAGPATWRRWWRTPRSSAGPSTGRRFTTISTSSSAPRLPGRNRSAAAARPPTPHERGRDAPPASPNGTSLSKMISTHASLTFVRLPRLLRRSLAAVLVAALGLAAATATASADAASDRWVEAFWPRAEAAGISRATYIAALGAFEPDAGIIPQATNQPEFVRPIWDYLDSAVSAQRIADGLAKLPNSGRLLADIEAHYGVSRYVVLAIWGLESSYGRNPGSRSVIRSLATLAYMGGTRKTYGETQLLAALRILQHGDVTLAGMTGSWAGAMGHTQFIPTSYEAYAVDWDGDGKRNVWTSAADALASTASYLREMGWETGKTWGYEVTLPSGFDYRLAEGGDRRTLAAWSELGIRRASGAAFPRPADEASLWMPAGANGPMFLLLTNFRVIKRYNNADSYALAIGHLADRLQGFGGFRQAWPREERPLTTAQRTELQQLLATLGYYNGAIDAVVGTSTRAAIRTYQRSAGLIPDGYPSEVLLQRLRATL